MTSHQVGGRAKAMNRERGTCEKERGRDDKDSHDDDDDDANNQKEK